MCRRITWLFKIQHEPEYIHFNDLNCTSIHSMLVVLSSGLPSRASKVYAASAHHPLYPSGT
jgi:hypothetical protein